MQRGGQSHRGGAEGRPRPVERGARGGGCQGAVARTGPARSPPGPKTPPALTGPAELPLPGVPQPAPLRIAPHRREGTCPRPPPAALWRRLRPPTGTHPHPTPHAAPRGGDPHSPPPGCTRRGAGSPTDTPRVPPSPQPTHVTSGAVLSREACARQGVTAQPPPPRPHPGWVAPWEPVTARVSPPPLPPPHVSLDADPGSERTRRAAAPRPMAAHDVPACTAYWLLAPSRAAIAPPPRAPPLPGTASRSAPLPAVRVCPHPPKCRWGHSGGVGTPQTPQIPPPSQPGQSAPRSTLALLTRAPQLATLLLMHPRMPLAFLVARARCWLMVSLSSTRTPRSLSAELLSSRAAPACTGAWGCSSPAAGPCICLC